MPHSGASSGTSPFLTPPLPGPRSMSPPPRLETLDYVNTREHSVDGRTDLRRRDEVRDKRSEKEERSTPIEPSARSSSEGTGLLSGDSDICAPRMLSDENRTSSTSSIKPMGHPVQKLRTDTLRLASAATIDAVQVCSRPLTTPSPCRSSTVNSLAVDALRGLERRHTTNQDSESGKLRRMSTTLANALNFVKSKTSTTIPQSLDDNVSEETRSPRKRRKRVTHHNGDSHHSTLRGNRARFGLLTPSTITLRKASDVHVVDLPRSSMSVSLSHEDESTRAPDAPPSELLAFYSTITNGSLENIPHSLINPAKSVSPKNIIHDSSENNSCSISKAVPPKVHSLNVRRHSSLASSTITFANVHVAPGTFAVEPTSRRQSLISVEQPPRRISVVQIRSRNSVHEVVWREDETASGSSLGSSSGTSTVPRSQNQSLPSATSTAEGGPSPTKQSQKFLDLPALDEARHIDAPQGPLFQWSWNDVANPSTESAPAINRKNTRPEILRIKSASNPNLHRIRRPSDPYAVMTPRRSVSEAQDILSFPPLRDRSSTLEWCQAPLVDLNDPSAGRIQSPAERSGDSSSAHHGLGIVKGVKGAGKVRETVEDYETLHRRMTGRRASTHPYIHARVGLSGRVGSSLGSSSHVRLQYSRRA